MATSKPPPSTCTDKASATRKNLGGVWLAQGGWSPYLNYSESFEPVAALNVQAGTFKLKRGKQVEAGVKWQPVDSRVAASAAVYELKETNRRATDPDHPTFSIQRGEVTVKGLEVEVASRLLSWDWMAHYSFTDAQVTEATVVLEVRLLGRQLEAIPRHSASVWGVHRLAAWPGLRAALGIRHIGSSADGADVLRVPAVTLFDALIAYDTVPWRFAFNANNLADKTYVASCLGPGDCWFGARRRAVLTVASTW